MTSEPITVSGTEVFSRDEIAAYFAALADACGVTFRLDLSSTASGEQDTAFLNRLRNIIEQDTDDAHNILVRLVRGTSEETIRQHVDLQLALGGISYMDAEAFLASFNHYVGKGLIRKPKRVLAEPQKLAALYRVTEALRTVQTDALRSDRHPLGFSRRHFDAGMFWIKDEELVALILDNPEHGAALADFIQTKGAANLAALRFVIDGGTKAVADGAL